MSKDDQGVWADAVVDALEYIQDAVNRAHEETIAAGIQYLLQLPGEVLGNNRSGSGQKRRAAARVRDLRKRSLAEATLAAAAVFDTRQRCPSPTPTVEDHALAGRIHRYVREGNGGRAARCLDSSPIAPINDQRHCRRIRHSLISRASAAAQGCSRHHGSQRDQASRS